MYSSRRLSSSVERTPRIHYQNYWTGESQDVLPEDAAELPDFLFLSLSPIRKKRLQNTDSTRTVETMRETLDGEGERESLTLPGDASDAIDIIFEDSPSLTSTVMARIVQGQQGMSTRSRSFTSME
jgi:hypothetical protein